MMRIVISSMVLFALLIAMYWALDWYMRWSRRKQLEDEYASEPGHSLTREDYVDKGLAAYERSLEKRLLPAVVCLPLLVIAALAFFIN